MSKSKVIWFSSQFHWWMDRWHWLPIASQCTTHRAGRWVWSTPRRWCWSVDCIWPCARSSPGTINHSGRASQRSWSRRTNPNEHGRRQDCGCWLQQNDVKMTFWHQRHGCSVMHTTRWRNTTSSYHHYCLWNCHFIARKNTVITLLFLYMPFKVLIRLTYQVHLAFVILVINKITIYIFTKLQY